MTQKSLPIAIGVVVAVALAGLAFSKQKELAQLRSERDQLVARLGNQEPAPESSAAPVAQTTEPANADINDESEILKLRNEIAQLNRRKRELGAVRGENAQLKSQVAAGSTNSDAKLPAGYIRKSQARMAGFGTPESTMESLLYCIHNHDIQSLMLAFTPEAAAQIQANLARSSEKEFFEKSGIIPGMAVTKKSEPGSDDTVELTIEVAPGLPTGNLVLRKIDGSWKIATPMF